MEADRLEQELTSQQQNITHLREESSQLKEQLAAAGKEVELHKSIMLELLSKWEEFSTSDTKEKQKISGMLLQNQFLIYSLFDERRTVTYRYCISI
jgi:predicted nuclease with TOPRIM domain